MSMFWEQTNSRYRDRKSTNPLQDSTCTFVRKNQNDAFGVAGHCQQTKRTSFVRLDKGTATDFIIFHKQLWEAFDIFIFMSKSKWFLDYTGPHVITFDTTWMVTSYDISNFSLQIKFEVRCCSRLYDFSRSKWKITDLPALHFQQQWKCTKPHQLNLKFCRPPVASVSSTCPGKEFHQNQVNHP